jgi:RNA polymerase sigma-70 factor (ECF subfamily)
LGPVGPSDAALVVEARGGASWALEALFRRHAPRLNGIAFRVMGRDDEIDDLVQDVFVAAFQTLDRLDDPNAFAPWIASILVRQALKKIRRRRVLARLGLGRAASPVDPDAIIGASAPPDKVVLLRTIYRALEAMPAEQRIALVLHRVEGYGLEETARAMGLSVATVKRRIVEADAELRARGGP